MATAAGARAPRKLSLKGRALALLAQREHSATELRRKLLRHARAEVSDVAAAEADDSTARVDAVIDWLRAQRYLSEERFIEGRVHARAGRYGNLRIRQELAQHGLALSPQASQTLRNSELERATEVWTRKFGAAAADPVQRSKQARFLAQRGFSLEVIGRVLRAAGASESAGNDD